MSLTGRAIQYIREQFPNANFMKDIIIQNDGNGPYIKYWGFGEKPSEEEVNLAAESVRTKVQPPSVEEQLRLLYEDQKNGTKTFSARIDAVGTNE